jgi:hypothetical protein
MKTLPSLFGLLGPVICGLSLAILTTGCRSFHRGWKAATAASPPASDISGPWDGSWLSDVNGHHGRLRCLVTRLDERHYRARYKATYRKILRFGYTVDMEIARPLNDRFQFNGKADLGWWGGGIYHYDGYATTTNLFSTYNSKYDHGTFQMKRPGG